MAAKYIFRVDDINPNMNWERFDRLMNLFKKYNVIPLLGIVPDNKDTDLIHQEANPNFWHIMRELQRNGLAEFAQHGYQHLRILNSEFSGLPYEVQYEKIKRGRDILRKNGIFTKIWIAPFHSYDKLTLKALVNLGFIAVSDGIALFPFKKKGLIFVPQQFWKPRYFPFGIITVCLHLNDISFHKLENFLKSKPIIISFSEALKYKTNKFVSLFNLIFKFFYLGVSILKRLKILLFRIYRLCYNFFIDSKIFRVFFGRNQKVSLLQQWIL
jgi:hypothetical protein